MLNEGKQVPEDEIRPSNPHALGHTMEGGLSTDSCFCQSPFSELKPFHICIYSIDKMRYLALSVPGRYVALALSSAQHSHTD